MNYKGYLEVDGLKAPIIQIELLGKPPMIRIYASYPGPTKRAYKGYVKIYDADGNKVKKSEVKVHLPQIMLGQNINFTYDLMISKFKRIRSVTIEQGIGS